MCAELYRNGHYRNAALDSVIAVVNFVKQKSRRHDLDAALMRTVFSRSAPIFAFNELKDQKGAVLALRNPRAHALFDDSPQHALSALVS